MDWVFVPLCLFLFISKRWCKIQTFLGAVTEASRAGERGERETTRGEIRDDEERGTAQETTISTGVEEK